MKTLNKRKKNAEPGTTARSTEWELKLWSDWAENRKVKHGDSPICLHIYCCSKISTNGCVHLYWKCADKTVSNIHPIHCTALHAGGIMRHIRQYNPEVNFLLKPNLMVKRKNNLGLKKRRVDPIRGGEAVLQ